MKKLLKYLLSMILVIGLIAPFTINKVNAFSMDKAKVGVYLGIIDKANGNKYEGKYSGIWDSWDPDYAAHGFSLDTGEVVYMYGIEMFVDLKPGETINLTYEYEISGIGVSITDDYYMTARAVTSSTEYDIDLPVTGINCDEATVTNDRVNLKTYNKTTNYTFTNFTDETVDRLTFAHWFIESANTPLILFEIKASYFTKKSSELIEKENNELLGGLFNGLNDMFNYFKGDEKTNQTITNSTNTNNELNNVTNQYNNIESELIQDYNENMNNIELKNDLFLMSDFIKTSTFITNQLTRIYESNAILRNLLMYSLIIGLSFTVIGIRLRS